MSILTLEPPGSEILEVSTGAEDTNKDVLHIVLVENLAQQRAIIREFLENEVFEKGTIEVHETLHAIHALETIDALIREGEQIFCLLDLHMDETGESPELNGDRLIANLVWENIAIPFAIASGTIAHERALKLQEGLDDLCFLKKDAFSPQSPDADRVLLAQRIRKAARESSVTHLTPEQVVYLHSITKEGMDVPGIHLLVDTIKAQATRIFQKHAAELRSIHGAQELLDVHGLYRGNAMSNVHEFKNRLHIFIASLEGSISEELQMDLLLFSSLLSQAYYALYSDTQSVDGVGLLQRLCTDTAFHSNRNIQFQSRLLSMELATNPVLYCELIKNILHNALIHGIDDIEVEVTANGEIVVKNRVEEQPNFIIDNGNIVGEMPTGSGIRSIVEACTLAGYTFSFSYCHAEKQVIARIHIGNQHNNMRAVDPSTELEAEPAAPFGYIGFFCQHNHPESSFGSTAKHSITGCVPRYIHYKDSSLALYGNAIFTDVVNYLQGKYDAVLRNMSVLFVHDSIHDCIALCEILATKYPHITVVPSTSDPYTMMEHARHIKTFPDNLLTPKELQSMIRSHTESSSDEIYGTNYSAEVLENIFLHAQRRALRIQT